MKITAAKTNEDILTPAQRWTGLLIVVGMCLLFGFLALHQLSNTGFFTDEFGALEMVCLYGPIIVSWIAPIVRAVIGRQNPSRPFDAATNLSLAMGSFWLWFVFPFDFAHLSDILPRVLRIITSLITKDVGKILLMLQFIGGPISVLLTMMKYFSVRRQASLV